MFCPDLHQLRLNVPTCDQWRGRPGQLHPVTYHMAGWERKGALSDTLFGGTHGGLDQTHSIRRHWMRVAMTAPPAWRMRTLRLPVWSQGSWECD